MVYTILLRNITQGMCSQDVTVLSDHQLPCLHDSSCEAGTDLVSRASRIFPCVRMRVNKFCVGGEGKIRLVTVARFSYRGGM